MNSTFALAAAVIAAAAAFVAMPAAAGADDYALQPVSSEVKTGKGVVVAMRLVNKITGKPVTDAIIFRSRLDMSPDGMSAMTAPLTALPTTEPGVYAFRTDLVMSGGWSLKLMAKVQGEPATIQGIVIFTAKD